MITKDFIFGSKKKESDEDDIRKLHDVLMVEYGWIPLEQFRNLPIPTLISLVECIRKRHEEEERQMKRGKH